MRSESNVYLALCLIGLSILWLTPALNAERISAKTQVKRYLAGKTDALKLPLWEMKNDWGRAGKAAFARIEAHSAADKDADLTAQLEKLEAAASKYSFDQGEAERNQQKKISDLQKIVRIVPADTEDVERFFMVFSDWELNQRLMNCTIEDTCLLVVDDFVSFEEGQEVIFFQSGKNSLELRDIKLIRTNPTRLTHLRNVTESEWPEIREKILVGKFRLVPSGIMSLEVGGECITPLQ